MTPQRLAEIRDRLAHSPARYDDACALIREVTRLTAELATVEARWLAIVNGNREIAMRQAAEVVSAEVERLGAKPAKVARWRAAGNGWRSLWLDREKVGSYKPNAASVGFVVYYGSPRAWCEEATEPEARAHIEAVAVKRGWTVGEVAAVAAVAAVAVDARLAAAEACAERLAARCCAFGADAEDAALVRAWRVGG